MTEPAPRPPHRTPPVLLMFRGYWGFGEHAKIRCDQAVVLNLDESPDRDPGRPVDASSTLFVPAIEEDVEPQEGLDVDFGLQVLRHESDGYKVVTSSDAIDSAE